VNQTDAIRAEAERREISRLIHFTPLRNLVHISTSDAGLKSTKMLLEEERSEFNQQDLDRLDGHPDHISCTIEYPNAYYMQSKKREARGEARIFPNWVCLILAPTHLWSDSTLLCPHNAGGRGGTRVRAGLNTFMSMFADQIDAPKNTWIRQRHPECCPTDAQAEVLVHRQVPLKDVLGIVVETESQAADTYAILKQLEAPVDQLPLTVAPDFYAPSHLSAELRNGRLPVEVPWNPPGDGDGEATSE
jgi:hypothetical protein